MPPEWHSEDWELRVAGIAADVFLRKYAITARLTRLEPGHWLWPAFARVRRLAASGHLPSAEPAARKHAVIYGVYACVDEVRAILGRSWNGRYGPSLRLRRQSRPFAGDRVALHDPGYDRVDDTDAAAAVLRRMHPRARLYARLHFGFGDGVSRSMSEVAGLVGAGQTTVQHVLARELAYLAAG